MPARWTEPFIVVHSIPIVHLSIQVPIGCRVLVVAPRPTGRSEPSGIIGNLRNGRSIVVYRSPKILCEPTLVANLGHRVGVAIHRSRRTKWIHIVADAVPVHITGTRTTTNTQGVQLIAIAVAVLSGHIGTTAFVDGTWTIAHTARVEVPHTVINVVADAVGIQVIAARAIFEEYQRGTTRCDHLYLNRPRTRWRLELDHRRVVEENRYGESVNQHLRITEVHPHYHDHITTHTIQPCGR